MRKRNLNCYFSRCAFFFNRFYLANPFDYACKHIRTPLILKHLSSNNGG